MPDSLVLQLQELASGKNAEVPELLRKSLLVATKLSLDVFRAWIDAELNGYRNKTPAVPEYRKVRAVIKVFNPYRGWMPLVIQDVRTADALQNVVIHDPIGNLIHLLETRQEGAGGLLSYPLSDQETLFLMEGQAGPAPFHPGRFISTGNAAVIIDAVRTKILDWSLELESLGVLGEGMKFSHEEVKKAVTTNHISIQNFQGILGDVTGQNTVAQNLCQSVRAGDFKTLAEYLRKNQIDESDIAILREALDSDPRPADGRTFGPKTSSWIGRMMSKAAEGSWGVSIEVAGNLISSAILAYLGGS